jgi:hypothetical protein
MVGEMLAFFSPSIRSREASEDPGMHSFLPGFVTLCDPIRFVRESCDTTPSCTDTGFSRAGGFFFLFSLLFLFFFGTAILPMVPGHRASCYPSYVESYRNYARECPIHITIGNASHSMGPSGLGCRSLFMGALT